MPGISGRQVQLQDNENMIPGLLNGQGAKVLAIYHALLKFRTSCMISGPVMLVKAQCHHIEVVTGALATLRLSTYSQYAFTSRRLVMPSCRDPVQRLCEAL